MDTKSTSTWFALQNPVFCRLWLANVLSGTFASAQDIAATWLMHGLGASAFALSFMATAASAPFFLFTLPAGAVADIVNRRTLLVSAVLWQGACSAVLAFGTWMGVVHPISVVVCIFALGIGLAFAAPVMGAIVPDIVDKDELPSAITLGGVQLNLSGIVGPALGGFLLPLLGPPLLISVNALTFLVVALAISRWKPRQSESTALRENFTESFISSLRYARHSERMKVILFRNLLFSLIISIVPALLPVIALRELHLSASQLGLVFTCVGVGSLAGAVFALPYLRQKTSPERDHLPRDDFDDRGAAGIDLHARPACSYGMRGSGRRSLGVGRIRTVGGWTAGYAGMGPRKNEFLPDHVRAGWHRDWGTHMGYGSGTCRSQPDLCCGRCAGAVGAWARALVLHQLQLRGTR